ncbi:hypothetical protein PMAYCL1PPCAC_15857 [Pristionchus mayeri]|uniref:Uncharacterized protein n=1 Tax=Pristionchus mayeri TaxID=1317129 RepID=A0AAN5CJN1_9BILA|nr:hypothetical protein PMAYCL1PPCAC_15857 [Pristionchus mayeri]
MKSLFLLLSAPLLIIAQQSYGVSNDASPSSSGHAPAAAPAYPLPVPLQVEPFHDILFPGRRHRSHRRHSGSRSSSSDSSSSSDDSCRRLKSRCERDDDNCEKAKVKDNSVKCKGKRGEIVQLQDGKGNLIDYGFGNVEVDVKCRGEKWHVRSFEGKRLKVKNVVCYRFALPAIVDVNAFETARSMPYDLKSFFDSSRVSDAINWSAAVFVADPKAANTKETQKALEGLDKALETA